MSKSIALKKPRECRSRDQWRETFERFDAEDLTVVAFCRQQGLCVSNFYRWRQLLAARKPTRIQPAVAVDQRDRAPAPSFVALPAMGCPATSRWHIELDLGDGVVLRLAR